MIFDAGVFMALESPAKRGIIVALVERMLADSVAPVANEPALAQAWRDPARQVPMAHLVRAVTVHPFGDPKLVGMRCARSDTSALARKLL